MNLRRWVWLKNVPGACRAVSLSLSLTSEPAAMTNHARQGGEC